MIEFEPTILIAGFLAVVSVYKAFVYLHTRIVIKPIEAKTEDILGEMELRINDLKNQIVKSNKDVRVEMNALMSEHIDQKLEKNNKIILDKLESTFIRVTEALTQFKESIHREIDIVRNDYQKIENKIIQGRK